MLTDLSQELMTPHEAARWFRRSRSWLRQQPDLLRLGSVGQPLFHVAVCRAWVLGRVCGLAGAALRTVQVRALAAACGLSLAEARAQTRVGDAASSPDAAAPIRQV